MQSPDSSSSRRLDDENTAANAVDTADEPFDEVWRLSPTEMVQRMVRKHKRKLGVADSSTSPRATPENSGQDCRIVARAAVRRANAKPPTKRRVVCVRNIPGECIEADLVKCLQHEQYFGNISYVFLDYPNQRSGELVAYVEFATGELADSCLQLAKRRLIKIKSNVIQIVCQTRFNGELERRTGTESANPTKILYLQILPSYTDDRKITVRDILRICSEAEASNVLRIAIEPDQSELVEVFIEFPDVDATTRAKFRLNGHDVESAASALEPETIVIGIINVAEFANMLVVELPASQNADDHYDGEQTAQSNLPRSCAAAHAVPIKQEDGEEDIQFLGVFPKREEDSSTDIEAIPPEAVAPAVDSEESPAAVVVVATNQLAAPLSIEAAAATITTDRESIALQNEQLAPVPIATSNDESSAIAAAEAFKSTSPISSAPDLESASINADSLASPVESDLILESSSSIDIPSAPNPEEARKESDVAMATEIDATTQEEKASATAAGYAFDGALGNDEIRATESLCIAASRGRSTPAPIASPLKNDAAAKTACGALHRAAMSLIADYGSDSPVASRVTTPAPATPLPSLELIPLPVSETSQGCAEKRNEDSMATSDDSRDAPPLSKRSKKRSEFSNLLRHESKETNGEIMPSGNLACGPWSFVPLPPMFSSAVTPHGPEPAPGFGLHKPGAVLKVFGIDMRIANCDHIFNVFSLYGNVAKVKFLRQAARCGNLMCALVQMGDAVAAQRAEEHLDGAILFGRQLAISHFKDAFIQEPDPFFGLLQSLPSDRSPVFKDYRDCSLNRFTDAMAYKRLRISYPKNALIFYGPPMMTEQSLRQTLHEYGAPQPTSVELWSSGAHESHGRLNFAGPGPAVDAIALANNAPMQAFVTDGFFTYSLQLSFIGGLQFEANGSLVPQLQPSPRPIRAPAAIVGAPTANVSNGDGIANQASSSTGVADMDIE